MSPDIFVAGVLASTAGALITLGIQILVKRRREVQSPYTGRWEDKIYNDKGEIVKRDFWYFRQRGSEVDGSIERFVPKEQNHRRWRFNGRLRGSDFFGHFHSIDDSIPSNGSFYVHQIRRLYFSRILSPF